MKKLLILTILSVAMIACSTYQKSATSPQEENEMSQTKEMIAQGYTLGTIVISTEEGDCPYKIQVQEEEGSYYLDPINIEDAYKRDGLEVWFKYKGLRMMNRCSDAAPISVSEMRKK